MLSNLLPEEIANVYKPAAAGILVCTPNKQFLLVKRSDKASVLPMCWSVPSGESRVNELESVEACAKRRFKDEMGYTIPDEERLLLFDRYYFDNRIYFLFVFKVSRKMFVTIDESHTDLKWVTKDTLPEEISPQILDAINRIG